MQWSDIGYVLHVHPFGEQQMIISVLTQEGGLQKGLLKKSKMATHIGDAGRFTWHARTQDQLGTISIEVEKSLFATIYTDRQKLSALTSSCYMLKESLPERHPYPHLYNHMKTLCHMLKSGNDWQRHYCLFEIALLKELGFGLDLERCAVTGSIDNLIYVSPKSGRAVCFDVGKPYHHKLLMMPEHLKQKDLFDEHDMDISLTLTGYFLEKNVFQNGLPPSRLKIVKGKLLKKAI